MPKASQDSFRYSRVNLVLAKIEADGSLKFIEDQSGSKREVWTAKGEDKMIEAGRYLLFVKIAWNRTNEDEFVLSSYGVDNVEMQETNAMENNQFLSQSLLNYCMTKSKNTKNLQEMG